MRKTDDALRQREGFMVHLVWISAIVLGLLAMVAFGVMDDALRFLSR